MILEDHAIVNKETRGVPHIIHQPGQSDQRLVGQWRLFKPVMQPDECNNCGLCWVVCPDTAISVDASEKPIINYNLCKGCLLCWHSCSARDKAIEKIRDTHEEA